MALQMSRALQQYGQVDQTGTLVSISWCANWVPC